MNTIFQRNIYVDQLFWGRNFPSPNLVQVWIFMFDSNWPTNLRQLHRVVVRCRFLAHETDTPPKLIWMDLGHANEMANCCEWVRLCEDSKIFEISSMFYLIFFESVFAVLIVQNFLEAWNWRAGHLKSQWSQIILKLWMSGSLLAGQNCRRKSQKRIEMVACELENFGWNTCYLFHKCCWSNPIHYERFR